MSAHGEGTTAELWLPAAVTMTEAPVSAGLESAADDCLSQRRFERLLVDDDPLVLISSGAMPDMTGRHRPP